MRGDISLYCLRNRVRSLSGEWSKKSLRTDKTLNLNDVRGELRQESRICVNLTKRSKLHLLGLYSEKRSALSFLIEGSFEYEEVDGFVDSFEIGLLI